jgi:murein DD-endopeptidase
MTRFDPPGGRPWGLFGLCGASLLLNLVLATRLLMGPSTSVESVEPTSPEPAASAAVIDDPLTVQADAAVDAEAAAPAGEPLPDDVRTTALTVQHSLARTFADGIGEEGDEVAAVVARLFVWDLDLRRDLMAGDKITVAWEGSGPGLQIPAARYESKKLGTLRVYRYTREGDTWPSWWNEEGVEVSRALVDSPIEGYEQITSLLKDRPKHRGMDFKAPEGIPVTSARNGTVLRTDWNVAANGNCVEVKYEDGTIAKYLHLSRTDVKAGQRLTKGTAVGLSGNTGRSTAPHLHYELEKNGVVVDPIQYHGVVRRTLDSAERARFDARIARLDAWLDGAEAR